MATKQIFNPFLPKRFQQVSISESVATTNVMFVHKGGDDAGALADGGYDLHSAWLNPTVAMANAVPGDTVVVYPGIYTIGVGADVVDDGNQQMVVDGVTLYMMPNATIQYTNLTGTASLPFDDGGVAQTFNIEGFGTFIFNRNIVGGDSFLCTTNAGTILNWESVLIDTRRRWGGTGHDAAFWRMKGIRYLNRESMGFAFRFPGVGANKEVHFEFEDVEFGSESGNNTWTRFELRNFGAGSVANVIIGKTTYPNAWINAGAYWQTTGARDGSIINIHVGAIERTGTDNRRDYLYHGSTDRSGGIITFNNVITRTGLILMPQAVGLATTKKVFNIQGVVLPGTIATGAIFAGILGTGGAPQTLLDMQINLDVDFQVDQVNYRGFRVNNTPNVRISGYLNWVSTNHPLITTNSSVGVGPQLHNLIMSDSGGLNSIANLNATTLNLRTINTYATEPLSLANGGINLLIEPIVINANV